jgi:hypothetical protein
LRRPFPFVHFQIHHPFLPFFVNDIACIDFANSLYHVFHHRPGRPGDQLQSLAGRNQCRMDSLANVCHVSFAIPHHIHVELPMVDDHHIADDAPGAFFCIPGNIAYSLLN